MIEDFKIADGDVTKCDHRPNSKTTSLILFDTNFLVFPMVIPAVCKECGKSFEFTKSEKTGKWVNIKNIKNHKEGGDQ